MRGDGACATRIAKIQVLMKNKIAGKMEHVQRKLSKILILMKNNKNAGTCTKSGEERRMERRRLTMERRVAFSSKI